MKQVIAIGPHLRFVFRDNEKILQQIYKFQESVDGDSRVMTYQEWVDVPIEVEAVRPFNGQPHDGPPEQPKKPAKRKKE